MKRVAFALFWSVLASCYIFAYDSKLSISTQAFLTQLEEARHNLTDGKALLSVKGRGQSVDHVDAFIKLKGNSTAALQAAGVKVYARFGNFVTASIPALAIEQVARLDEVVEIDMGQAMQQATDSMRSVTHADLLQEGQDYGFDTTYDGRGVVLGIIDVGFDYNHLAFLDKEGHTRIKRVYYPNVTSTTGAASSSIVLSDGVTKLPGEHFDSAAVYSLTSDLKGNFHGSHTLSIAAGTRVGPYGGMAPGADIVVCSLAPKGYEFKNQVAVANAAKYITDYARSVGKRCVISMSAGASIGPRDGSSYLCQVFDRLSAPDDATGYRGAVFCLSAGNNAGINCDFKHLCTNTDSTELQFGLMPRTFHKTDGYGVSLWTYGKDLTPFGVQYVVLDPKTDSVVYQTQVMKKYKVYYGGKKYVNYTSYDRKLSKYFEGRLATWSTPVNGRYELNTEATVTDATPGKHYKLILLYYAPAGTMIYGLGQTNAEFLPADSIGPYGFIAGNDSCSINDDCTAKSVISVGAYTSKNQMTTLAGKPYRENTRLGEIASFSSFGIGLNGVPQPFVIAPGNFVVGAINSYSSFAKPSHVINTYSQKNPTTGRVNYWGRQCGTSMATPCVAGIVATWLQAHPDWTVDSVKAAMRASAIVDDFVKAGGVRYGCGKVNALGGIPAHAFPHSLATILSNDSIHDGDSCRIVRGSLQCVYVSPDGKTLYVKDSNGFSHPNRPAQGEVDYVKSLTPLMGKDAQHDQSNWLEIKLPTALDGEARKLYQGHRLNRVQGKLLSKQNPVLEAKQLPIAMAESCNWTPNAFVAANLHGNQRVALASGKDSVDYFFVTPKPKEIASFNYVMWNEKNGMFETPTQADSMVVDGVKIATRGLKGAFKPNFELYEGDSIPALIDGGIYRFLAMVDRRKVLAHDGETESWESVVFPLSRLQKLEGEIYRYDSLAVMLKDSTFALEKHYRVIDSSLICAHVSHDRKTLYVSDNNHSIAPDVIVEGQVDYDLQQQGKALHRNQCNWLAIALPCAIDTAAIAHYVGHKLTGVEGTLVAKDNPQLVATRMPVPAQATALQLNVLSAPHFYGSQRVQGLHTPDSVDYFFMRPKPMEVDTLAGIMWNAKKQMFEVPTFTDSVMMGDTLVERQESLHNLKGEFRANFSIYDTVPPLLVDRHVYSVLALVRREVVEGDTAWVAYPLTGLQDHGEPLRTDSLHLLLSSDLYRVGHNYGLPGGNLLCVYVSPDGKRLVAKDANKFQAPDVIEKGEVDYIKSLTPLMGKDVQHDQSNWLEIKLPTALDGEARKLYQGHRLNRVQGKLLSKQNPVLEAKQLPVAMAESCNWTPNAFVAANLHGNQRVALASGKDSVDYFFVTPKPKEIASFNYVMWNEKNGMFETPTQADSMVVDGVKIATRGLKGAFKPNFELYEGDSIPALIDGGIYRFLAMVDRRKVLAHDGETESWESVVFPLSRLQKLEGEIYRYDSLAVMLKDSTFALEKHYRVIDSSLICAHVSHDRKTLYVSDNNHSIAPDVIVEGQVDYDLQQQGKALHRNQCNWLAIALPCAIDTAAIAHYVGHKLTGVEGTLVAKDNPQLVATRMPVPAQATALQLNVLSAPHFYGSQRVQGLHTPDSVDYFFMRPKPMEVDTLAGIMWNAKKQMFEVPTFTDSVMMGDTLVERQESLHNLKGEFRANFSIYDTVPPLLVDRHVYSVLALVRREVVEGDTAWVAYPLTGLQDHGEPLRTDSLHLLLSSDLYRVGHNYGLPGGNLLCVYVSPDGKRLVAKDANKFQAPDVIGKGEVDYIKTHTAYLTPQRPSYDQSNWVQVQLSKPLNDEAIKSYQGRYLDAFVAKLESKFNPSVVAIDSLTTMPDTTLRYQPNTFLPANFYGTQLQPGMPQNEALNYFFVRPKAMEIAVIDSAMWNAQSGCMTVASRHYSRHLGKVVWLQGSFEVDLLGAKADSLGLIDGHSYRFLAQVMKTATPAGNAGWQVRPLSVFTDQGLVPLVGDVNGDGKVDDADVKNVVNIILQLQSAGDLPGSPDVWGDGVVNVSDATAIIGLMPQP